MIARIRFTSLVIGTLSLLSDGALAEPAFKRMFGKTITFKLAVCKLDATECVPSADRLISFDNKGNLTEAFMCGDRRTREHHFGRTSKFNAIDDGNMKSEKSVSLSGSDDSIFILSSGKLTFADGATDQKNDHFKITLGEGTNCSISGSREIIEMPENKTRTLKIVGSSCDVK